MKCDKCGKEIAIDEKYKCVGSVHGLIYYCKECYAKEREYQYPHRKSPSTEDRIEELEKENKLVKDILYSLLYSLRELEDISNFELCNLDRDTFKDFYKLEEMIDIRSKND